MTVVLQTTAGDNGTEACITVREKEVCTSQDCLLSMIFRMVSLRAWWTKGVAVAFMYCSISVLASVVALNNVVASSGEKCPSRDGYSAAWLCIFLN